MTFSPNEDIYTLSLDQGAKPRPFLATAAIESNPSISPDGRWMAYTSTRPGEASLMTDVYVVRFPEGTGKVQITNGGGGTPFWNSDSHELFFTTPPGVLQSVPISPSSRDRPEVGPARTLFALNGSRIAGVSRTDTGSWRSNSPRLKHRRRWWWSRLVPGAGPARAGAAMKTCSSWLQVSVLRSNF